MDRIIKKNGMGKSNENHAVAYKTSSVYLNRNPSNQILSYSFNSKENLPASIIRVTFLTTMRILYDVSSNDLLFKSKCCWIVTEIELCVLNNIFLEDLNLYIS